MLGRIFKDDLQSSFWIFSDRIKSENCSQKSSNYFSKPHIEQAKNGTWAVVAGEYERQDWANKAIHKLLEAGLMGGIWL